MNAGFSSLSTNLLKVYGLNWAQQLCLLGEGRVDIKGVDIIWLGFKPTNQQNLGRIHVQGAESISLCRCYCGEALCLTEEEQANVLTRGARFEIE